VSGSAALCTVRRERLELSSLSRLTVHSATLPLTVYLPTTTTGYHML